MHGVTITEGVQDWEILAVENGCATVQMQGKFTMPKDALKIGVKSTKVIYRVLKEEDNSPIYWWTDAEMLFIDNDFKGEWSAEFVLPAGGLYRIETALDTQSTTDDLRWIFRGDVKLHIGVGHVFIIAGQSNAAGYGRDFMPDAPSLYVHTLRNCLRWDLAAHPLNESTDAPQALNAEMGVSGTSPYISFGKELNAKTNLPVGLIVTAMGGQPISRWDSSRTGDLLESMLKRASLCRGKISGVLWYQGCSDAMNEDAYLYKNSFKRMVNDTRNFLGYDIPFFTFQLNRYYTTDNQDTTWGVVREAQRALAGEVSNVFILPTISQPLCDGIHNNSAANVLLGAQLAKQCYNVLQGQNVLKAPDIMDAYCHDLNLTLTFENVERGILISSPNPAHNGFVVEDDNGEIAITAHKANSSLPSQVQLILARRPTGETTVSLNAKTIPSEIQVCDEVTYLAVLSFFKFPVNLF